MFLSSLLSEKGVGGDREVESDEEGMEDKGCDSKPRSGMFFSGTLSSSGVTSYAPIGRNFIGDIEVSGTSGIGYIRGWRDCVVGRRDVKQVGEDEDWGCWVLGIRAREEQIEEDRICGSGENWISEVG